jgi:hypothetical protein
LAHLTGLDAFWAFAAVTLVGLSVTAVLLWAVVLHDHTPLQAWLALGLFVVSPAAVYSLADHYLVDSIAYAFLAGVLLLLQRNRLNLAAIVCVAGLLAKEPVLFAAPIVLLLAVRSRARAAIAIIVAGAPALYLVVHHTNWIANGAGRESPFFYRKQPSFGNQQPGRFPASDSHRRRGRFRPTRYRRHTRVVVSYGPGSGLGGCCSFRLR